MNSKKAKQLRKIAVAFSLLNPNLDVKKEYKKLKAIHKESNHETQRPKKTT